MSGPAKPSDLHVPAHPVRFVTAAALFDGHDAAINIMRRILQAQGAEVVHLGHDRSVREVVDAILDEDAQAVAISSYQGGHVEYFEYLAQLLTQKGAGHVRVFGGGGGVIVPEEITRLAKAGVRIFSPEDGQRLGLPGMINELIRECDVDLAAEPPPLDALLSGDRRALARAITCLQAGRLPDEDQAALAAAAASRTVPVLGITGTGGSGKSSLTDELIRRFRTDQQDKLRIAVLAVDPTRRRGGGALLGDRIRMNALGGEHVFFRSLATRGARELPERIEAIIGACQAAGYDLVILETPGIGQGDAAVVPLADVALYVMTPEFGAPSQLEKIDMLDFADVVAINKFERRGAADALRDVSRQLIRNRSAFGARPQDMPVFGTSAATFNDNGVTALYQHLAGLLAARGLPLAEGVLPAATGRTSTDAASVIPPARTGYLAEIAGTVRGYHEETARQAQAVRRVQRLAAVRAELAEDILAERSVASLLDQAQREVGADSAALVAGWPGGRGRLLRAHPGITVGDGHPAGRAASLRRPRGPAALPARGEPAGVLPVYRRGVPVQAGGRGPGPDVRRRGRPVPHQPAVQAAVRREPRHPAVHRVRLGDAVRPGPGGEPGRVRQGRHLGGVDRHLGGHDGAVRRVRPDRARHVGVDDDQRAGPRRSWPTSSTPPSTRAPPGGSAPPTSCAGCGAPCRPTSSRRTRARTPASSPPSSPCG